MLNNQTFYHQTIRNIVVAFGNMFANIRIQRRNTNGTIGQTIAVPIAYSQKEKWIQSIEQNPEETKGTYTTLPRLAFEISSFMYDPARKLARMNPIHCTNATGRRQTFTAVPYNVDISLYFATKTQEDGFQILEQILPTFTPEYTLSVNVIPELNIVHDIPFILNATSVSDEYEGDLSTRRFIVHTLSFTSKINLYGAVVDVSTIRQVEANMSTNAALTPALTRYVANQPTPVAPINENWTDSI